MCESRRSRSILPSSYEVTMTMKVVALTRPQHITIITLLCVIVAIVRIIVDVSVPGRGGGGGGMIDETTRTTSSRSMIMAEAHLVIEIIDEDVDGEQHDDDFVSNDNHVDADADATNGSDNNIKMKIYHEGVQIDVYEGPTECDESNTVTVGDRLGMHYTGTIDPSSPTGTLGKKFDSSRDRGIVLDIPHIGFGTLIDGWDFGLLGLCRGAKAVLIVPPDMGYGENGVGEMIPPYATLKFDVEIVSIQKYPPHPNLFDELDTNHDNVLTSDEVLIHFQKENRSNNNDDFDANDADSDTDAEDAIELPENLMENSDTNNDGVIDRTEFGSPEMSFDMCLEMLHHHPPEDNTLLGLSIQWLCYRPRSSSNVDDNDNDTDGVTTNNNKIENTNNNEEL